MKRTPLKRTAMKRYRRKPEDMTDPRERAHVLARDGECIARKLTTMGWTIADPCADAFGNPIPVAPVPPEYLTLEHVKPELRMGRRANSSKTAEAADPLRRHSVAACTHHNNDGWCSANRSYVKVYLEWLARHGRL